MVFQRNSVQSRQLQDPALEVSYLTIIRESCRGLATDPADWMVDASGDQTGTWIHVAHHSAKPPEQGWKLHVSATLWSAQDVLRRVLPVLLIEPICFKIASSPEILVGLNDSTYGNLSQVGKFITVYPVNDDQAVRLASALSDATEGLSGPPVPSDRPVRRGGIVFYRYGGFGAAYIQTPIGEITPAIRMPSGELVPDSRSTFYQAPQWLDDPFEMAGIVDSLPPTSTVIGGGRYAIAAPIHQSPRGAVYLALDVKTPTSCVLKKACFGAQPAPDGTDARHRLRREAHILRVFASDDCIPNVFELFEHGEDLYLAMEDMAGETLEEIVGKTFRRGTALATWQVVDYVVQLTEVLGRVHTAGYVYRDLKPTNVIATADGLRLVDFEMTRRLHIDEDHGADDLVRLGLGTRGYMSPQQAAGEPAAISDDIYSLGALLFLLTTGAEPSRAPHPFALLERPLVQLSPSIDPALAAVIGRCLDPDPMARPSTMDAVKRAVLDRQPATGKAQAQMLPAHIHDDEGTSESFRDCAKRLGDAICADALPVMEGAGAAWISPHKTASGLRSRDLYVGSGGTLLALAELVDCLGEPSHRAVLAAGARWLAEAPSPDGDSLAGLYVGESGVGASLLQVGQVLKDESLVEAALERGRRIATLPFTSPDLMNGTAGRLRFHLLLWDATGDSAQLKSAIAAGDQLLASSSEVGPDQRSWVIPPGYSDLSGTMPLGYGHGAAGIADTLLDLFDATHEERFRQIGQQAGRWLSAHALPALSDETGLAWPMTPGADAMPPYWCHGAAGIGRFYLHAAALDLLPEANEMWRGAARATAHGARWADATQCHGLSGSIDFLLDAYQASGNKIYLDESLHLSTLLMAFRTEDAGILRWPSDWPWVFPPDYMVGYAGVAMALLRLADPEKRQHLLSRAGFRQESGRNFYSATREKWAQAAPAWPESRGRG